MARQSPGSLRRGFSLVELLVVMSVLAVLGAAIMPLAEMTLQRERERELKQALWQIREAIDAYHRAAAAGATDPSIGRYPPTLEALTQGSPAPGGLTQYFLRRIPRDPFAPSSVPAEKTWGLRSYQSPPDRPQPGPDVYDVYSLSSGVGLNGIPLKDW